jgi:hypothetical protein
MLHMCNAFAVRTVETHTFCMTCYMAKLNQQFLRLMLSMYIGQQVKVLWNGIYSHAFPVLNGVKQGAILSPLLFCVYIDSLLLRLQVMRLWLLHRSLVRRCVSICR